MQMRTLVIGLGLVLVSGLAMAAEVYINGTRVTGAVRAQAFQGVNVQFDAKGDVYIDAPGFKVQKPAAPAEDAPKGQKAIIGQKRLWLVVNVSQLGHYRILVKLGGKKIADVASTRRQSLTDVSAFLQQGKNDLEVIYLPIPDAPRIGEQPASEVIVGIGKTEADGSLTITRVLASDKKKTGSKSAEARSMPVEVP